MRAAVLYGNEDIRYEENYPEPEVKPGMVKVRSMASGICGSDIPRVLANGARKYPIILGHECGGYVVETGDGVESVKPTQSIDLVIKLEEWDKSEEYDRLGLEEQFTEILGNKVVCHSIPIRPGRNLAIIVESAAVNHRQKKMGYNAAIELYNRVTGNLQKNQKEE